MPKPSTTGAAKRGRPAWAAHETSRTGVSSTEARNRIALSRFTYSGGYDGYEGRMILKPEAAASAKSK